MNAMLEIRRADSGDKGAIVQLWHQGWHDAHSLLVPPEVLAFRGKSHFFSWLEQAPDTFYLAFSGKELMGFVSIKGSEVVKLYLAQGARGSGVGSALLNFAEGVLRQDGVLEAELFCTAGNTRAERFYQRQGWRLIQTFEDALWVPSGINRRFNVSTHRFCKSLMG